MKNRVKLVLFMVLLSCGLVLVVGCRATSHPEARFQTELRQSAQYFRSKVPSNRIEEAQQLLSLLPSCPVAFRKDIESGILIAHDYSTPSYYLTKVEVVKLLGKPTYSTPETYRYLIGEQAGNKTFLEIKFQSGFAVESTVYTSTERLSGLSPKK